MLALLLLPLDSQVALYAALVFLLILSSVGAPVPEEITLLLGGYLAYLEFIDFWVAALVLVTGILIADTAGYLLGYLIGDWLSQKISRFSVVETFFSRVHRLFDKHGEKVMLFSRPLLGVRVAVPIMAGHFRMNFAKFLLFDMMAAVPWTLFWVSLSYYLGSGLELITGVKEVKHFIMVGIILAVVAVLAVRFIRKYPAREIK